MKKQKPYIVRFMEDQKQKAVIVFYGEKTLLLEILKTLEKQKLWNYTLLNKDEHNTFFLIPQKKLEE